MVPLVRKLAQIGPEIAGSCPSAGNRDCFPWLILALPRSSDQILVLYDAHEALLGTSFVSLWKSRG